MKKEPPAAAETLQFGGYARATPLFDCLQHLIQHTQIFLIQHISADEIRAELRFGCGRPNASLFARVDTLDKVRHVPAEIAHRLQSLQILHDILGRSAVDHVPIGGRDNRHLANGEIFVQHVEGGRRAAPARRYDDGARLAGKRRTARIKGAVEKRLNLPRGVRVVHGRAEHEAVARFRLFGELVRRVVKDAFANFPALAAGDAVLHGPCAYLKNLRFDALFLQRFGDLAEGGIGAAVRARTAVDKQNFHNIYLRYDSAGMHAGAERRPVAEGFSACPAV